MNKSSIREKYKAKREVLSMEEIDSRSKKINELLFLNFNLNKKKIHTFLSIDNFKEVNTSYINNKLFNSNCVVATSITLYNPLSLDHSIISKSSEYFIDRFNIPVPTTILTIKPEEIDFVLIPLLAFDNNGNRIGYGKGLYDSFLKDCKNDCIKIGLSLFNAEDITFPTENHDIKLDYCITPSKVYNF